MRNSMAYIVLMWHEWCSRSLRSTIIALPLSYHFLFGFTSRPVAEEGPLSSLLSMDLHVWAPSEVHIPGCGIGPRKSHFLLSWPKL